MSENQNGKWVEELKESPIFNMSLSSKELFHSNFIGWILETYPAEMGKRFSEVLGLEENEKIENVQREKNNIDLSFELGDALVLIENKVKSIAYKEQLDKYSKHKIPKDKKAKYILLSLKKPIFFKNDKDETPNYKEWIYVSYEEFIREYLELLLDSEMDEYHESLIRDYINFINILDKNIMQEIDNTSIVNFYQKDTDENKLYAILKDIRMHDFFQKGLFENLAQGIHSKLKKDNVKVHLGKREKGKDYNKTVTINHGMTRAVGLLDIKYQYDKDITIGIQIQGNQYRKIIEGTDEEKVFLKAEELKDSLFSFPGVLNEKEILPLKPNTKLEELVKFKDIDIVDLTFNKYHTGNHLFLYKYATLDKILGNEDTTEKKEINQKLVDLVCEDIENMIQHIKE